MPVKKNVLVVLVLDETGSMEKIQGRTISSVNEYVQGLLPQGKGCHMTLIKFNSAKTTVLCSDVPVKDVPKLDNVNYRPGNNTPLYDAVAKAILDTDENIKVSKIKPDVLFVVLTDGEENSSREYNREKLAPLITERETNGWTIVYLGANQDSWGNASSMGYSNIGTVSNFNATPDGVLDGMAQNYAATTRYFHRRNVAYGAMEDSGMNAVQINNASFSDTSFLVSGTAVESLDKDSLKFKKKLKAKEKK
jgi:hypothetical protein